MISSAASATFKRDLSFLDEERGVAALELALVLPLLTTLLLGAADIAITASRARHVEAVAASAVLAVRATTESLLAGLAASLPGAPTQPTLTQPTLTQPGRGGQPAPPVRDLPLEDFVSLPEQISGTVRLFYGCAGDSGIVPSPQFRCPNGAAAVPCASIEVNAPSGRLVAWPGDIIPADVRARSIIRLD